MYDMSKIEGRVADVIAGKKITGADGFPIHVSAGVIFIKPNTNKLPEPYIYIRPPPAALGARLLRREEYCFERWFSTCPISAGCLALSPMEATQACGAHKEGDHV